MTPLQTPHAPHHEPLLQLDVTVLQRENLRLQLLVSELLLKNQQLRTDLRLSTYASL